MHASLPSDCLSKLPSLRLIGLTHDRTLDFYRLCASNNPHFNLPPLFAEIYDFPRKEDETDEGSSPSAGTASDDGDAVSAAVNDVSGYEANAGAYLATATQRATDAFNAFDSALFHTGPNGHTDEDSNGLNGAPVNGHSCTASTLEHLSTAGKAVASVKPNTLL